MFLGLCFLELSRKFFLGVVNMWWVLSVLLSATEVETALLLDYWPSKLALAIWVLHNGCLRRRWIWSLTYFPCVSMCGCFYLRSDEHVILPCPRSWTRTASLNLDCSFSQTCVATAHATTSFVCFFVDGSLDDSFMFVALMVVPGHVDVVLCCLLDGICK